MKCKIIFEDWQMKGIYGSVYQCPVGVELSSGDLHSGTTFDADITIHAAGIEDEIQAAMNEHHSYPVFKVVVSESEKS